MSKKELDENKNKEIINSINSSNNNKSNNINIIENINNNFLNYNSNNYVSNENSRKSYNTNNINYDLEANSFIPKNNNINNFFSDKKKQSWRCSFCHNINYESKIYFLISNILYLL